MSLAKQNYNINNQKLQIIVTAINEYYIYVQEIIKTKIYINHIKFLKFIITKILNL